MKSLHLSLEASLKKLRTTYVDILYLHWVSNPPCILCLFPTHSLIHFRQWDYQTSVEEVMNGLHALVMAGKVLYLVRPLLPPNSPHSPSLSHSHRPLCAMWAGRVRRARVGRLPRKPVRARPRQDALQRVPGPVERHAARPRARGDPDGPRGGHGARALERPRSRQDPLGRAGAGAPRVWGEG